MFRTLSVLLLLNLMPLAASAQTPAEPPVREPPASLAADAPVPAPGSVAKLMLALRLQTEAELLQDALGLAVAANMAAEVQLRPGGWTPKQVKVRGLADLPIVADTLPANSLPPGAMLAFLQSGEAMAAAMLLAEEDDAIGDVLEPLAGAAGWHQTGAATYAEGALAAGAAQEWQLPFDGQSPAEVSVLALDGLSAIWWVEDSDGEAICPKMATSKPASCAFTPEVNSYFRILVEAPPAVKGAKSTDPARYLLLTN